MSTDFPELTIIAAVIGGIAGLLLVLTMGTWVGVDAARRRRNWFAWTIVVELFSVLGLIVWLFVRRRSQPASQSIGARHVLVIFATVLILFALDVVVRVFWTSFVFQVARVEGHAMSPTLNDQRIRLRYAVP